MASRMIVYVQRMIPRGGPCTVFIASTNQEGSEAELSHGRKCHRGEQEGVIMSFDEGRFRLRPSIRRFGVHSIFPTSPATLPE